jgi:hypothetical protein
MRHWTTPADIRAEVERLWSGGRLLACVLQRTVAADALMAASAAEPRTAQPEHPSPAIAFPHRLRFRGPQAGELGSSFDAVREWVQSLSASSRSATGAGFDIAWRDINTRQLGRNRLPAALILPSLDDALALIDRNTDAHRFARIVAVMLARLPELRGWIERKSLAVLQHDPDWPRILDVLDWFLAHPKSGLYLREIDVAGVDTKFIEARKTLFSELLDVVLASDAIAGGHVAGQPFELRYGLKSKPTTFVRFRVLDPRLAIAGFTDLTVQAAEFAALDIGASHVFIVENEVTFLAFPDVPGSLVLFGGGYGIEQRLAAARWLSSRTVIYWGDIDTHGFAILDRLRAVFAHTQSLLMDRATLVAHRAHWSFEGAPQTAELSHLESEERAPYDDIRYNRLGSGVRLEQERVPFDFARSVILGRFSAAPEQNIA